MSGTTCGRCGRKLDNGERRIPFDDGVVCLPCAEALEEMPETCPVCGTESGGDEAVAMLMTRVTATPQERLAAKSVLVRVCPKCRTLHFDGFQYGILRGMRNNVKL